MYITNASYYWPGAIQSSLSSFDIQEFLRLQILALTELVSAVLWGIFILHLATYFLQMQRFLFLVCRYFHAKYPTRYSY